MDRDVSPRPGALRLRWIGVLLALTSLTLIDAASAEESSAPTDNQDSSEELLAVARNRTDAPAEAPAPEPDEQSLDGVGTDDGASAVDEARSLETPRPTKWGPSYGRQCHRYKGRRFCQGPRKIALPHGKAEERAKRLGLGTRRTATVLQRQTPLPEWIEVIADGASADENSLHWPVDGGKLWRGFGYVRRRGRRRLHRGIDVGAPAGTSIRSVQRGLVAYSDNTIQGYGNMMLIVHADETVAWYAHSRANYAFAGQVVQRGQIIGEVGATGLAQGAHLHFELRREGRPFNPLPLFENPPVRRRARQ